MVRVVVTSLVAAEGETTVMAGVATPAERLLAKLPDNTLGFIASSGEDSYGPAFDASMLGQVWHAPSVQQFYQQFKQAVQTKLAEMKMYQAAARRIMYKVAWMKMNDMPAMLEASIAKLFISEVGLKLADHAVQIHGGYGYMRESTAGRAFVDMRLISIGGGADEVLMQYVARMIGL